MLIGHRGRALQPSCTRTTTTLQHRGRSSPHLLEGVPPRELAVPQTRSRASIVPERPLSGARQKVELLGSSPSVPERPRPGAPPVRREARS